MYRPVQESRFFTFNRTYSAIDWNDFPTIINAFSEQLEYWYILPCLTILDSKERAHFSFAVALFACLLIDCLSQFESGETRSNNSTYKTFLRNHWSELAITCSLPITALNNRGKTIQLTDGADVIYHGLRCGIFHEAHTMLYCGLASLQDGKIIEYIPAGITKYKDGKDCPSVRIDAVTLFHRVHERFEKYFTELLNPDTIYNDLRYRFCIKFRESYGIDVSSTLPLR